MIVEYEFAMIHSQSCTILKQMMFGLYFQRCYIKFHIKTQDVYHDLSNFDAILNAKHGWYRHENYG
jgi:hypothetical protein